MKTVIVGYMLGDLRTGHSIRKKERIIVPENEDVPTYIQNQIKNKYQGKSLFYWDNAQWNKLQTS